MAKQTKETYWKQGNADHAAVKLGNKHALARQAWANGSQSWQARAYRDGMQEAQDIENGYYTPAAVWMRTPMAERIALLHQAGTQYGAARAFDSLPARVQFKLAHVINGTAYLLASDAAPAVSHESPAQPRVIAFDDWMVWARDAQGRIVETCTEMWPEWLDEDRDPSDMETDEYRAAVLRILRTKRPQWRDTMRSVLENAARDEDDPKALLRLVLSDVLALEAKQAAFIAAQHQDERIAAAIGNAWTVLRPIHPTVAAIFEIRRGLDARIHWFHRATGTLSDVAFDSLYAAERAALAWLRSQPVRPADSDDRERMIVANRVRSAALRIKHGTIATLGLGKRMQGPRHAPGLHWPNGEVIARSQFQQVERHNAHGELVNVWQWAALDDDGFLLQVMEFADLWELREEAAFQIADGSRFARSQWRA